MTPAFQVFQENGEMAIYLSSPIVEAHAYDELCHLLRRTDEDVSVTMYINSNGGDLYGGMAIIHAMRDCRAPIKTVLQPVAMSMAALIFLAGDEHDVPSTSYLMLHHFRDGAMEGKANEILAELDASIRWFETVVREVCSGFLSEREIRALLAGKDFWFQAGEMSERLAKLELAQAAAEATGDASIAA
jgi:ATP-dependent protease ClpP protease subunit